jgi:electron transport complex protein RnfG
MKTAPIIIAAVVLSAFSVTGVALVAVTHHYLDHRIADNQRMAMQRMISSIVPAGVFDNDPLADLVQVSAEELLGAESTRIYRIRKGGEPTGVILEPVVPDGYAGPIQLLVSVMRDGSVGGVRVLFHHETPGLGDKIEERKSDWVLSFDGKSLANPAPEQWAVKRDGGEFDQFTGATITPRAIVKAVKNTLIYVQQQGDTLFEPGTDTRAADGSSS